MTLTQRFRTFAVVAILSAFTLYLLHSGTWDREVEAAPAWPTPTPTLSGRNTPTSAIVLAENQIIKGDGFPLTLPETKLTLAIDYSSGAFLVVDAEGDKFICEIVPATHEDMQECQYAP